LKMPYFIFRSGNVESTTSVLNVVESK